MSTSTAVPVINYILSFELFLGGQARLTSLLTPTLHKRAMSKASGTQKYLSFIPISDPILHSKFIGGLMCLAGSMLLMRSTRRVGSLLSGSLSVAGIYSQSKMRIPYWLPCLNTVLAVVIFLGSGELMSLLSSVTLRVIFLLID